MASGQSETTASRIRQFFVQWNIAGQWTRLFESWPDNVQADLRGSVAPEPAEQLLVACHLDSDAWTLLTNQRLIWRRAGRQLQIPWGEISDVNIDDAPPLRRTPQGRPLTQRMLVMARDGASHALELEAGPPISWFWMALKTIARQSGKAE
jgi:hypothetical protein